MAYKVGMVSLGCPKNQVDAELMLARLKNAGMTITADPEQADVVIVNTCGFIEDAKRESIENILEFANLKNQGRIQKIIVTGCLAQRYQNELVTELPECDGVLGLGANGDIVAAVQAVMGGEKLARFPDRSCWQLDGDRLQTTPHFFAYLRIGDGCNNCCSYCAIPLIRGRLQSRRPESILEEAAQLAAAGVKELILVAQDVTAYGTDFPESRGQSMLPDLLEQLCRIEGVRWIRLLYCYPQHISDRLLSVIRQQDKIVKYMDVPLQHVSGRVLSAMNRSGDADSLLKLMNHIREMVPGIVLRSTVMTGFPGETKEDFEQLCQFIQQVKFERLGCFAYSPEEGTVAASMPHQIPKRVKERRRELIMQLQTMILDQYNQAQVGRTVEVLVEGYDRAARRWFGRTAADAPDIDCKVYFTVDGPSIQPGDFVQVRITDVLDWDLQGQLVSC